MTRSFANFGIRYAPSPTGHFHIGNLRTAWISHRLAQFLNEKWILRFEDIDTARIVADAARAQLDDLKRLGMIPDQVYFQTTRRERHWTLFLEALRMHAIYPCVCTRHEIRSALEGLASAPHGAQTVYSGTCRDGIRHRPLVNQSIAWRFRSSDDLSGAHDFIIARTNHIEPDEKTFIPAYHWACGIDDYDGRYRFVVRAWDLLPAAAQHASIQKWIQNLETHPTQLPKVFHTSLVIQNDGHRLEKRTQGVTLAELNSRGLSNKTIIEKFTESFQFDLSKLDGDSITGEARRQITLSELLD